MEQLFFLIIAAFTSIGITLFWRTCIYTRGAIFRPIGRILDRWVRKGSHPDYGFGWKFLRFLAFPLGRCMYCSQFHFGYYSFFLVNFLLGAQLPLVYLVFYLPITHLMLIYTVRLLIEGNSDMQMGDWDYMISSHKLFDLRRRSKKPERLQTTVEYPETVKGFKL